MIPAVIDYPDRAAQAQALARDVADALQASIAATGRAVLSVPGGTTPGPFLRALAGAALHWPAVTVVLNDERWVPPDHPRSNARLLGETLLTGAAAQATTVPLYRDAPRPEEGLAAVAWALRGPALPLDVLVLGMGEDMHTASLFPGADRLAEALDPACAEPVLPMRAAGAAEPRITLTLPALLSARQTHILITGEEKRVALDRACEDGPEAEAPIRAILRRAAPTVHYAP